MTTEYRGQADVGRCCAVRSAAGSNWMPRLASTATDPEGYPEPDVAVLNEGSDFVIRGWLPERRPEWERFAEKRLKTGPKYSPARRTAALIYQDMQDGKISAEEAARLMRELI